jgi:penicillin-binding protein 1A
MTLGGLREGLTPLELAYAYATIANAGERVTGSLATRAGPVGVESVEGPGLDVKDEVRRERVFPKQVGETAQQLLAGVVQGGTGKNAQIGEFAAGKTGTTENYGDAWFVGFNKELTVAVWVGYADHLREMKTEYHGSPVAGGTYPTEIWHDFMTSWIGIRDRRAIERGDEPGNGEDGPSLPTTPLTPAPQTTPEGDADRAVPDDTPEDVPENPQEPAPQPEPAPTPAPAPQTPVAPGTGGGATPGGEP